jgi:alanine racemase
VLKLAKEQADDCTFIQGLNIMHCWIELSAKNLHHNLKFLRERAHPATVIPIIKANGYGHGLKEMYEMLSSCNPDIVGVNYLSEGETLRHHGFNGRIICVGPSFGDEIALAWSHRIEITIGSRPLLERWLSSPNKPDIHVKFDTGMSRQGFLPEEAWQLAPLLKESIAHIKGLSSHFANVEDVLEQEYAMRQLHLFKGILETFQSHSLRIPAHIASSASGLIFRESEFDYVRAGISLYGLWPSKATRLSYSKIYQHPAELLPVLSWYTKVASTKLVPKDQSIGYGCTYKAMKDMTIAVLPVGYYEGYPRLAGGHGGYVLLQGSRCPIVGRICMNMMMIDISHLSYVAPEEKVTLIGKDKNEEIDAETFASWASTIHYEALSRLNPFIERRIV